MPLAARASLVLASIAGAASAQIVVPPGFCVSHHPIGSLVTGLAVSDGGAYGNSVFASVSGAVKRLDRDTGVVTTFASGLNGGSGSPSGLCFDPGNFGFGMLYVCENASTVKSISSTGVVALVHSSLTVYSANDLVFPPPGSAYGPVALVSTGNGGAGTIAAVMSSGVASTLAPAPSFSNSPLGVDFAPPGSGFGTDLYSIVFLTGQLVRVDSAGAVTPFVTGLGQTIDVAFSPDPNGPFGDLAYVTKVQNGTILRVEQSASFTTFATGFTFSSGGFDAEVAFSPDGSSMFVANGSEVVEIQRCSTSYCTAGTSTNGCAATMSSNGIPSAAQASGFQLVAQGVEGQKSGLIFYGITGRIVAPWGGGSSFLCVKAPTQRMTTQSSGGTAGACDGVLAQDWSAYVAANPTALGAPFSAGQTVDAQTWYRDPPSPKTTQLSNGIEFDLLP